MKTIIIIIGALLFLSAGCLLKQEPAMPDTDDRQFLEGLCRSTWNYLDSHLAGETGFPTDSQHAGGVTNTTNIGLYLAAIGPACKMGLISEPEALSRIKKILASLGRLESSRGFLPNWIHVDGTTAIPEGVFAVSDFNKLVTGLILVRQFFPSLNDQATEFIERVEWEWLYDDISGRMHWGYDLKNDTPVGPTDFWLASDCRLVMFYTIASGAAPPELWDRADRTQIQADGLKFYAPGYEFGGLFMQAMGAIFLNEMFSEMGSSIADLAWHQIRESQRRGLPAWGWSNCNIPRRGYTEGGFLPWWVITPHASALVIGYYPQHVINNLRKLQQMGMRKPLPGSENDYGFRDSINLITGQVDNRYLSLDQAMLFLSLVNYLHKDMVREYFSRDPLVSRGLELLGKKLAAKMELAALYAKRDKTRPKPLDPEKAGAIPLQIDFTKTDLGTTTNTWGAGISIKTTGSSEGLEITYDLGPDGSGEAEATIRIPPVDARNLKDVRIICGSESETVLGGLRVYFRDDQGQSQFAYINIMDGAVRPYIIRETGRYGMFARPHMLSSVTFKLWGRPWYYTERRTKSRQGKIILKKMIFSD